LLGHAQFIALGRQRIEIGEELIDEFRPARMNVLPGRIVGLHRSG
jgi:hypothetical protein